ncbi:hypothetical protein [Mucilaginibacter ginsenosidivorax]|uniref:Uncharacterized protein n=1 Tax=Mucilaginibacter ginsenosidivorax TaxID=862126 RepID=A0A5B8W0W5_9SPHI|nr:hypothetical protein [Mucilaginibacter ginsenosidivorax]QEC77301.1 hypothetical protein FSB76_15615 [Mucilaginibacter ginsenosidivorax]
METKPTRDTNPITGDEGAAIDLELAAQWTRNHRHRHPNDTVSQFFGNKILNHILQQDGCMGIRIYYANDEKLSGWQKFWVSVSNFILSVFANVKGQKHFVIVGVSADGEDQLPDAKNGKIPTPNGHAELKTLKLAATASTYLVGEMSAPCPGSTGCPQSSVLSGSSKS